MKARRAERVRSYLGARILFNNNNSTIECNIRNISTAGAKLIVSPTVSLPEEFDLLVPLKGRTYRCRLRWRIDDAAGVEFLALDNEVEATSANTRLRDLAVENEALRNKLAELMLRLAEFERNRAEAPDTFDAA